jgi:hypothetical protein
MQIRDVIWGTDGWPLPGLPEGVELKGTSRDGDFAGEWIHQPDYGDVINIELTKDGQVRSPRGDGTWKLNGKTLTFTWPRPSGDEEPFVDQVQLAYGGRYYVGRNRSGAIIRGIRRDATPG